MRDAGFDAYYNDRSRYANKWIRTQIGERELVATDIDLVTRAGYDGITDYVGSLRLLEIKSGMAKMGRGQEITYAEIDALLRAGDYERNISQGKPPRYEGLYEVRSIETVWTDKTTLFVNGQMISMAQFREFLLNRYRLAPKRFAYDWPPYSV